MHASGDSANRRPSISWPRTIGKSILYGVAAAGLGNALGWGILIGIELADSAARGPMRLPYVPSCDADLFSIFLLTLVVLTPVCVMVGTITSLLLRGIALRGRLSTIRAAATGGLVGVGAVALAASYDIVNALLTGFPGEWSSGLELFIYLGAVALSVGAWYGWRMGRWLNKQRSPDRSAESGVPGDKPNT